MLRYVVRRGWVQRRLLSAIVLLLAVATTLIGFYVLLIGVTGPRAFSEQIQRSQPDEVGVTAYAAGVRSGDLETTRQLAGDVVQQVLAPAHPTLVSTATSQMREIGASGRLGYLATTDALAGDGALTSGRWPQDSATGPIEAVAPDAAARTLGLRLGDRLTLGPGTGLGDNQRVAAVVIVGTFRGLPRTVAESDPLSGAGVDPSYNNGRVTAATYGPFLVGGAAFVGTGFDVAGLRVDGQPDLRSADDAALRAVVVSLGSANALLSERVGGGADATHIGSGLPVTLERLHTQQATTRSAVLVALLLDTMLALAALVLAGRLLADTRQDEGELMVALGLGRGQQVTTALIESALLAGATAILAVPAAAVAYAAATHLPTLRAARLTQAPALSWDLVVTVLVGSAVLSLVVVASSLVRSENGRLSAQPWRWVRAGVDVLLLLVALGAWWQLHSQSATAIRGDAVLVLAPALCLTAVTIVAVRGLPPLFGAAAAAGSRSRSLLPVSLNPPALRLGAGTALVLLSLASAAAAFGVAAGSTWQRSQTDQADLRVGTDLSFVLDAQPTAEDAARIAGTAVSDGVNVSPVIARPVVLGQYLGARGEPPALVALDTRQAGALLRGRPADGTTWSGVGARLQPDDRVEGVALPPRGAGITLVGHAPPGVVVSVTPSLVVQDATGFRSTLETSSFPVDGKSRLLRWSLVPTPDQHIVAVHLSFATDGSSSAALDTPAAVSVDLDVPGQGDDDEEWQTHTVGASGILTVPAFAVHRVDGATVLTAQAQLALASLVYEDGELLATAFAAPPGVPAAVSQALVDATGIKVGGELAATVNDTAVVFRVVDVVPTVPSAPGRVAVLADADNVSRALISTGHLEPAVNAFWVSRPTAGTARALDGLGLGVVSTRDEVRSELTRGPMQVTLPVAYLTVVGSAVLLLLAGAALVVSADRRRRTAEVARLRALGLPRGGARRLVFAQHGTLLVALVLVGVLIGTAAAIALDRLLVRSDQGTAPVPSAVLAWPWTSEILLTVGLLVGVLVVAACAAVSQVGASDMTQLRESE